MSKEMEMIKMVTIINKSDIPFKTLQEWVDVAMPNSFQHGN